MFSENHAGYERIWKKIENALLLSAATMVAETHIAYRVYNDGEFQGFGNNREVLMKCVSGNFEVAKCIFI
jgi:hypothetical protein